MSDFDELRSFVDYAIEFGKDKLEGIIVKGTFDDSYQIRFSQSAIDISKNWKSLNLGIFVAVEGAQIGLSERVVTNEEEVKEAIDDTITFTKHLPESMFFAGVETNVSDYAEVQGGFDDKFDTFVEKAPEMVNAAIDSAMSEGAKRVAGALKFSRAYSFFKSSYGLEGLEKSTMFDLNVRAFQDELDYSGQGLECGTIPSAAEGGIIAAGKQAGELSKKAIGAEQGEPGTYDLVLSPTVAADITALVPGQANPFMVLIGTSPLGDKIGEQLAPEFVTVTDDPTYPGGISSGAFDFEGTPKRRTPIIEKGVLKSFIHNTTTGIMYGASSTGNSQMAGLGRGIKMLLPGNSNIVFEPGDQSLEEMLETTKPTIYITCNWYTRFQNYQSGEFSTIPRDAMFLIKDGEMKPIKNLRISDNTLRMLSNISALGKERKQIMWWEVPTPTIIPAVKVSKCRMTAATL